MAILKSGDKAPDFKLVDQDGKLIKLADFRGKKLLLYFYPKADTPGCTKQACSIRDARPEFSEIEISALGISPDDSAKQKKFDDKYSLGFPLLSDKDHAIASAYGAWGQKKRFGKTYEGILRSAFLIDEKGKIREARYNISPEGTVSFAKKAAAEQPKITTKSSESKKAGPGAKSGQAAAALWDFKQVFRAKSTPGAPSNVGQALKLLKDLFATQRYAVLATQNGGEPYENLIAFNASEDLKSLVFVTGRDTKKYKNLTSDPKSAILIDNRSNQASDLNKAVAVTALGTVQELSAVQYARVLTHYLKKHPQMAGFAAKSGLFALNIERCIVTVGLNYTIELTPK